MALGTVIRSFASPDTVSTGLAWDGRYLWLAGDTGDLLYQIDPVTGTVVRSVSSPSAVTFSVEVSGHELYVGDNAGNVRIIDIITGTAKRTLATGIGGLSGICLDGGRLWACSSSANLVYQVDIATGTVIRSFAAPANAPRGICFDGRFLWISETTNDQAHQVDPVSGTVIRSFNLPAASPYGLTWDGRTLWHTHFGGVDEVYQLSVSGSGTYYYVDATGGNDANNGMSPLQAWQTIAKVNGETFLPGDRIHFKRGETWTGTALVVPSSGVSGSPITFAAYDSGADPIIDGNDAVNCIVATNRSYINFEEIECTQGFDSGFQIITCDNINITGCNAHDSGNDNILFITDCLECTVSGGEFYNAYQRVGGTTVSGIEITDGCHDITIDGVTCRDQADGGMGITIHSHDLKAFPYNITISNSICHSNTGNGLQAWKQDDAADVDRNIDIDGCTFYGNTLDGVRIYKSAGASEYPTGITVRDCYSYTNTRYAYWFEGDDLTVRQCRFRGRGFVNACIGVDFIYNTMYFETGAGLYPLYVQNARCSDILIQDNITDCTVAGGMAIGVDAAVGAAVVDIDYNLYYLEAETVLNTRWHWRGVSKNWADWLADSAQDANSPAADQDPLFVDPATFDFHLQAGSPARGVGIDLGNGTDLGAYQFGS